ncbi:MAG: hypothetical protein ACK4GJ_04620, partial [bacterium]
EEAINKILAKRIQRKDLKISGDYYEIVRNTGLALATSGTVVLKNSLLLLPTICFYKLYKISEFIFRKIKRIDMEKFS